MTLSDNHLKTYQEQGFVVVENFYEEEKRACIAAALRETMPPWEETVDHPPEHHRLGEAFPYDEPLFNKLTVDWDLIDFVQRALETEDIHFRFAHNWAKYPEPPAPEPRLHIDNNNNSLLPPCDDTRYAQISSWYFPEEVGEDQAPMRIIPKPYGQDLTKQVLLVVPAGTLMIFNTHLWHSATVFKGEEGQRYSVTRIYGRSDHYWEGLGCFTSLGLVGRFAEFIGTLTARERELFRFPPAGHSYYNGQTLALLEKQYPGWNARGEYA